MLAPVAAMKDVKLASYEPLIELAAGGMATVYIARHLAAAGFERLVVIKRVHPHLLRNREFCDMFRDEAHVCAAIRSANVVPVIDVVEADGELFLVLEYVESLCSATFSRRRSERTSRYLPRSSRVSSSMRSPVCTPHTRRRTCVELDSACLALLGTAHTAVASPTNAEACVAAYDRAVGHLDAGNDLGARGLP